MTINWLHIGLGAGTAYALILAFFASKRRWTWAAMGVALSNFAFVLLHLVAPFRGLLDADYAGYKAGMLSISPGPWVSIVTGSIVMSALTAACLALLARPGRGMAFIAVVDALLLLLIGLPELLGSVAAPDASRIQLGEYLVISGTSSALLGGVLFCAPLALSIVWSARRIRPAGAAA